MPAKLAIADQMTIEEFQAFYESRPDGEKWELIEGVAVMSPTPTDWHQVIATNILTWLSNRKAEVEASWTPMIGIGTRVPVAPSSLPEPDVHVKEGALTGTSVTDDGLVLFEVLSKSNDRPDQAWRRRVYASVPNCQHYVTVESKAAVVVRYDRADGWKGVNIKGLAETLSLPAIDVEMPLSHIYRWTPIA